MAKTRSGNLSRADRQYIINNIGIRSEQEIADAIQKSVNSVSRCITEHNYRTVGMTKTANDKTKIDLIQKALRNRPEWKQFKAEFSSEELKVFTYQYAMIVSQFNSDVLPTEELQIFQAIKLHIMMSRIMRERNVALQKAEELDNKLLALLNGRTMDKLNEQEIQEYESVETLKLSILDAQMKGATQYLKLEEKSAAIMKTLKATRDQRIKDIEKTSETFLDIIRKLESNDWRTQEGRQLALFKKAMQKERKKLSESHVYCDGIDDKPLLSADTIGGK